MTPHDLDRQLEAALEAHAAPEQVARLAAFWQAQSRTERRRRQSRQFAAFAASLLAVAAATAWLTRPADLPDVVVVLPQDESPRMPQDLRVPPPRTPQEDAAIAADPRSAGRAPTGYEQAMFAMLTRTSAEVLGSDLAVELDQAIDQLAADRSRDAAPLAEAGDFARRPAESMLLKRWSAADPAQRDAIVRLLAVCGTPRSLFVLLQAARRPPLREQALAAVEQIVGLDHLAEAVPLAADHGVRALLLQRLLAARSAPALQGFLALASQPTWRGEALAAAAHSEQFPIDELIAQLASEEKSTRLAAALVLGHVDGPRVAQALIALVSSGDPAPVEAWVALLACRDAAADRFLAQAVFQPRWLAQVNNARVFWARFTP